MAEWGSRTDNLNMRVHAASREAARLIAHMADPIRDVVQLDQTVQMPLYLKRAVDDVVGSVAVRTFPEAEATEKDPGVSRRLENAIEQYIEGGLTGEDLQRELSTFFREVVKDVDPGYRPMPGRDDNLTDRILEASTRMADAIRSAIDETGDVDEFWKLTEPTRDAIDRNFFPDSGWNRDVPFTSSVLTAAVGEMADPHRPSQPGHLEAALVRYWSLYAKMAVPEPRYFEVTSPADGEDSDSAPR